MCPGSVFRHSHSALAAHMLMLPSAAPLSKCVGAAAAAGAKKRTALTAPLPGLSKNPISVFVCESDAGQAAPWLPEWLREVSFTYKRPPLQSKM